MGACMALAHIVKQSPCTFGGWKSFFVVTFPYSSLNSLRIASVKSWEKQFK
jgi:hypothetical protein